MENKVDCGLATVTTCSVFACGFSIWTQSMTLSRPPSTHPPEGLNHSPPMNFSKTFAFLEALLD